ncbi:MAG TPA: cyclic pyranopterin monophosphate synthase MoaC [Devosia sp.]|nr:cyclic pyranopterin monophosphate synthase MoaC [Devosia sp.]
MSHKLTHLNERGEAHIVDIGGKTVTARRAVARARLEARPETVAAIAGGTLKKGDALAVARIAGIMAAKKTSELIPLCHPIGLNKVEVDIETSGGTITVTATAETDDRTGVEMEAMTAASVAALALYDMAKGIDRAMRISTVELVEKSGGKSGTFRRDG